MIYSTRYGKSTVFEFCVLTWLQNVSVVWLDFIFNLCMFGCQRMKIPVAKTAKQLNGIFDYMKKVKLSTMVFGLV